MKLFIWKNFLKNYTSGIAFALAENIDEARKLILDKYKNENPYCSVKEIKNDLKDKPLIIDYKEGFYTCGGA